MKRTERFCIAFSGSNASYELSNQLSIFFQIFHFMGEPWKTKKNKASVYKKEKKIYYNKPKSCKQLKISKSGIFARREKELKKKIQGF